jgi:hypothetical protein
MAIGLTAQGVSQAAELRLEYRLASISPEPLPETLDPDLALS